MTQINVTRERRKIAIQSVKEKGWSHQQDLKALVGKSVAIETDRGRMEGTLVAADQFSLKIKVLDPTPYGLSSFVVIFKSAVTYFMEIDG